MAQTKILANQGPNSVNGGGTPIVPLDPPPSDAAGGTSPTPAPGTTPTQPSIATTPDSHATVLTPTSGGSLTDGQGNIWTLTSGGIIDENGQAVPDGSDTASLTYVASTSTVWGQDAASKLWYQWTGSGWTGATTASPGPGSRQRIRWFTGPKPGDGAHVQHHGADRESAGCQRRYQHGAEPDR